MNIKRLCFQAVNAYFVGNLASSAIYNLTGKYDGWEKFTCVFTGMVGIIAGKTPSCQTHPMRDYCCKGVLPLNLLDTLVLGACVSIAISFTVKRIFSQHTPQANNNDRDAQDIAAQLLEKTATTKADTPKSDPFKELETDSVEALLANNTKGDAGALAAYTATKASDKRRDFDTAAASAVTSYGSNSNNLLALDRFRKEDSIVGSALAGQIMGGTQLFAAEEDFETRKNDGTVTIGRRQVVKTTTGTALRIMETTTIKESSTKSKTIVLVSKEDTGTDSDGLLALFNTFDKKNK